MITGVFIALFLTFFNGVMNWLPLGWGLPSIFFSAAIALATPLQDVSWFLPVQQLIVVILLTIPIMSAVFTWKVILFLLGVIRRVDYARNKGYM